MSVLLKWNINANYSPSGKNQDRIFLIVDLPFTALFFWRNSYFLKPVKAKRKYCIFSISYEKELGQHGKYYFRQWHGTDIASGHAIAEAQKDITNFRRCDVACVKTFWQENFINEWNGVFGGKYGYYMLARSITDILHTC